MGRYLDALELLGQVRLDTSQALGWIARQEPTLDAIKREGLARLPQSP
jgi:hypothetical protein